MRIASFIIAIAMAYSVSSVNAETTCDTAEIRLVELGQFEASADRGERLYAAGYVWAIMSDAIENETEMATWHYEAFLRADELLFDCWQDELQASGVVTDEAVTEMQSLRPGYRTYAEEKI